MGQFKKSAFIKFLKRCESEHNTTKRGSDAAEDAWIQRQADYIRFLWEAYQTNKHFNQKDSNKIWEHAYMTLKKEFMDFKELHKKIETQLKDTDEKNKIEKTKELMNRLASGSQELDNETTLNLLTTLKDQIYKQRFKKMVEQIKSDVKLI